MTHLHYYVCFKSPMLTPVYSGPYIGVKLIRQQLLTSPGELLIAELVRDHREKDGPLWWKVYDAAPGSDLKWLFEEAIIGVSCSPPWVQT